MKPIIRLITEQDIDATHTYFSAIFAEHLPTLITRERPQAPEVSAEYIRSHLGDHSAIFIAIIGSQVVGNIAVTRQTLGELRHRASLGMSVAQAWRRQGIGRALLQHAVAWASTQGIERIELEVTTNNPAGIAFYESAGFVREGIRPRAIKRNGGYIDLFAYALEIAGPSQPIACDPSL
jgi:putative acetyltransferase